MSKTARGRRVLTTSDSQIKHHGLGKEYSVKLNALAKDQRKTPQKYLEDIINLIFEVSR